MTAYSTMRKRKERSFVPSLILATLGTGALVIAYFTVPGFQPFELILLFIPVALGAWGARQTIIRALISLMLLYIATGVAATFHLAAAPFVGAPFSDVVNNTIRALSFAVLTVVIWVALEAIARALVPVTDLPALGALDQLGAFVIYLVIGIVVASVAFNTLGFSGKWKRRHDAALLRPTFNRVFSLYYTTQSFWFSGSPPRLYVYDME